MEMACLGPPLAGTGPKSQAKNGGGTAGTVANDRRHESARTSPRTLGPPAAGGMRHKGTNPGDRIEAANREGKRVGAVTRAVTPIALRPAGLPDLDVARCNSAGRRAPVDRATPFQYGFA